MKLDLEQIKALMEALKESGLSKLKIKQGDEELVLEHEVPSRASPVAQMVPPMVAAPVPTSEHREPQPAEEVPKREGQFVTSPIVGTFYRSPSPEADTFVEVGDTVNEGAVVCIIEAMKVMNEVKAGAKGVIKEILVDNGDPVEFGTQLFRIG